MYAMVATTTTTTMITTTSAPTAVATPVTRPSELESGSLESMVGVGVGRMAELIHTGSDTNSPDSSNTVHAELCIEFGCMLAIEICVMAPHKSLRNRRNSYDFSDLRMSIPTSEQQCGRGSMYSPVLEQLMRVKPASNKLGRC